MLALGFFITVMMFMPKVSAGENNFWRLPTGPAMVSAGS